MGSPDGNQALSGSYNDLDKTLKTSGFLGGVSGNKVTATVVQSSPAIDDFRFFSFSREDTMTTSSGSPTISGVTDALGKYSVGQYLSGTGIPANSKITALTNTSLTLNNNATASASVSVRVHTLLYRLRVEYDDAARTNLVSAERIE